MFKTSFNCGIALSMMGATLALPAHAAFIEDSKANLEFRNFYFNGDNRHDGATPSKLEEWGQGFIFKYESGFTKGAVGFGVDAIGLLGVRLDSSPSRSGSGLFPQDSDGRAPDNYGRFGAAAKVRFAQSTLRVGEMIPSRLPTLVPDNARLMPQTFRGATLISQDINGLTARAGRLTETSLRNASGFSDLSMNSFNSRGGVDSDKFDFLSLSYQWNKQLSTSYDYAKLDLNYKQQHVNLVHVLPLGDKRSFRSDIRYAHSTNDGNTNVDNKAFGAMFTYSINGHALSGAVQNMDGNTGFPFLRGTIGYLVNFSMISPTYAHPEERSWQARYSYDFAAMGIPGLSFMTRYVKGTHAGVTGNDNEWERNTDIGYIVQSGKLKNLDIKLRNGTYRSNTRKVDQTRFIVSYTVPLI